MGLRAREKERDRERGGNHETMGEREEERSLLFYVFDYGHCFEIFFELNL